MFVFVSLKWLTNLKILQIVLNAMLSECIEI